MSRANLEHIWCITFDFNYPTIIVRQILAVLHSNTQQLYRTLPISDMRVAEPTMNFSNIMMLARQQAIAISADVTHFGESSS